MALQNFVDRALPVISAAWLNAVDLIKEYLGDGTATDRGDALYAVKTEITGSVETTGHDWNEAQTLNSKANFGIPADGTTQTSALVTLMTTLAAYRGVLQIAHGTAFDERALIAAVPNGMQVRFRTTWLDGSYQQKFDMTVNGGDVDDDAAQVDVDKYHSVKIQLNTGRNTESKNDSGARRFASDYQAIGFSPDFNGLIFGLSRQRAKHPTKNVWQETLYVHTPLEAGMAETHGKWVTGQAAIIGERVRNSVGYVYEALTNTTNGASEPTGTGASISDGATTWRFVQYSSEPRLRIANTYYGVGAHFFADSYKVYRVTSAGTTAFGTGPTGTGTGIADGTLVCDYTQASLDIQRGVVVAQEDGTFEIFAPAGLPQRLTMTSGARAHYIEIDDDAQRVLWRDEARGVNLLASDTAGGLRLGRIQSLGVTSQTIAATGAAAITSAMTYLAAPAGPFDITNFTLPAGQTSGWFTVWLGDANLVIKNNANIVTRTGADITGAANMMITLFKDESLSSACVVWAKN